jgi:hypothetical protein
MNQPSPSPSPADLPGPTSNETPSSVPPETTTTDDPPDLNGPSGPSGGDDPLKGEPDVNLE